MAELDVSMGNGANQLSQTKPQYKLTSSWARYYYWSPQPLMGLGNTSKNKDIY